VGSFQSSSYEDGKLMREFFRWDRTEIIRAEDFFRSIALPYENGHHRNKETHVTYKGDILDVLWQVQPKLRFKTRPIDNETLRPVVEELSFSKFPLDCHFVPNGEFIRLANFFVKMLNLITGGRDIRVGAQIV
jgi:hypothetical protein